MTKTLVANITDIAPGTTKQVAFEDEDILLCNVGGTVYAINDVCTHDGGNLDQGELDGCEIECPRHGARFDVRTGEVKALPAVIPVAIYRVVREGDDLFLEV